MPGIRKIENTHIEILALQSIGRQLARGDVLEGLANQRIATISASKLMHSLCDRAAVQARFEALYGSLHKLWVIRITDSQILPLRKFDLFTFGF